MPKRKVTKEKGSTNKACFTPDKIIAQSTALATFAFACSVVAYTHAKTGHTVAAPSTALLLNI